MRVVVDTGVLVSGLLRQQGITGEILHALRNNRLSLIYTTAMILELIDVLGRDLFHTKYHINPEDITALINLVRLRGELVVPDRMIRVCRNHKDDKFLEAAIAGKVEAVASGDADLL